MFVFSEHIVRKDPAMSSANVIQGLYLTVYNRFGEWSGFLFWVDQLERNGFDAVAAVFTQAPEFDALYGGLSPTDQVAQIYRKLLGREPEPEGRDFWASKIEEGFTIAFIAREIGNSAQGVDADAFAQRIESSLTGTYGQFIERSLANE